MPDNTQIITDLFKMGVGNALKARRLYEEGKLTERHVHVAFCLRAPPTMSINQDGNPPLLYPKWCYETLQLNTKNA